MLSKAFEWLRATTPTPSDDLVKKRTATVTSLVGGLDDEPSRLLDYTVAAVAGVSPAFAQDSEFVTALLAAVKLEQPAFPESLSENALDLRVVSALVVGEVIKSAIDSGELPETSVQLAATLIVCALHPQFAISERYLRDMLSDLRGSAATLVRKAGSIKRTRWSARSSIEAIKEAADVPAYWKAAQPHFLKAVDTLSGNAMKDREELNLLWWFFNRYSDTVSGSYPQLPLGVAALCMGVELGDLSVIPHWPNVPALAERLLSDGRSQKDLSPRSLKDFVEEWPAPAISAFQPSHEATRDFVRAHAVIMPLSWGALLHSESNSKNWVSELKRQAGWDSKKDISASALVDQIYNERIAQRLLTECLE